MYNISRMQQLNNIQIELNSLSRNAIDETTEKKLNDIKQKLYVFDKENPHKTSVLTQKVAFLRNKIDSLQNRIQHVMRNTLLSIPKSTPLQESYQSLHGVEVGTDTDTTNPVAMLPKPFFVELSDLLTFMNKPSVLKGLAKSRSAVLEDSPMGRTLAQLQFFIEGNMKSADKLFQNLVRYDISQIHALVINRIYDLPAFSKMSNEDIKLLEEIKIIVESLRMAKSPQGHMLNSEQMQSYLEDLKLALKPYNLGVTFDDFPSRLTPQVSLPLLYRLVKQDNTGPLLEQLRLYPGFKSGELLAVVKGGRETYREALMIKLAQMFHLGQAVLPKDVATNLNITVGGRTIHSGFIADFIPEIHGHDVLEAYQEARNACTKISEYTYVISNKKAYDRAIEDLRELNLKAYGLSLYVSLLFLAADDHDEQYTIQSDKDEKETLQNIDMARNLPPGKMVINYYGQACTILRCFLLDFPQLSEPLDPEVIAVIKQNDISFMRKTLEDFKASQYLNPFKVMELLTPLLQKQGSSLNMKAIEAQRADILKSLRENANYAATRDMQGAFKAFDEAKGRKEKQAAIENIQKLIGVLVDTATVGTQYNNNWVMEELRTNKHVALQKAKEAGRQKLIKKCLPFFDHADKKLLMSRLYAFVSSVEAQGQSSKINNEAFSRELTWLLKQSGLKYNKNVDDLYALFSKQLDQNKVELSTLEDSYNRQLISMRKNTIDERAIEHLLDRQQRLLDYIGRCEKEGVPIIAKEMLRVMHPEELLFFEARQKLWGLPSLTSGLNDGECLAVIRAAKERADLFTTKDIEALTKAMKKLEKDAVNMVEFGAYCLDYTEEH